MFEGLKVHRLRGGDHRPVVPIGPSTADLRIEDRLERWRVWGGPSGNDYGDGPTCADALKDLELSLGVGPDVGRVRIEPDATDDPHTLVLDGVAVCVDVGDDPEEIAEAFIDAINTHPDLGHWKAVRGRGPSDIDLARLDGEPGWVTATVGAAPPLDALARRGVYHYDDGELDV